MIWLQEMLPKPDVIQLLSHATVFVCPSIYEPLGIVNLEAMACEAAVVATAVGGIVEVVADGETGLLVPFEAVDDGSARAGRPRGLRRATSPPRVNALLADPAGAEAMGGAGRRRAVERFSWPAIAAETVAVYERAIAADAPGEAAFLGRGHALVVVQRLGVGRVRRLAEGALGREVDVAVAALALSSYHSWRTVSGRGPSAHRGSALGF